MRRGRILFHPDDEYELLCWRIWHGVPARSERNVIGYLHGRPVEADETVRRGRLVWVDENGLYERSEREPWLT